MSSVLDFGADPTGVADSTAAILAAIAATPTSGQVCFPYTSSGGTYLCDTDQINAAGKVLQGDAVHASLRSTIKARTAGTALVGSSSECSIVDLVLDGNSNASYGLNLTGADRSIVRGVSAISCNSYGIRVFEGTRLYFQYCAASSCANGVQIIGSAQSEFYGCSANNNTTIGIYVAGPGSGLTAEDCDIKWFGGQADNNTGGPQTVWDGVEGALLSGTYVEGATPGIQLDNGCYNNTFEYIRFVGGDAASDFAFTVLNGSKNSFIGCSASGTNGRRIWISSTLAVDNTFVGCYRASAAGINNMTLYFDDGGGGTYTCEQRQGGFTGASAPTVGTWRAGDIVWDNTGGVTGWICTADGTPGTWSAF